MAWALGLLLLLQAFLVVAFCGAVILDRLQTWRRRRMNERNERRGCVRLVFSDRGEVSARFSFGRKRTWGTTIDESKMARYKNGKPIKSLAEKLISRAGANGCLEFLGFKDRKGYGRVSHEGKMLRAHRLVWQLTRGPIPAGMCVCHCCDNPSCISGPGSVYGTLDKARASWRKWAAKNREAERKRGLENYYKRKIP
jgi:hypothetical protein